MGHSQTVQTQIRRQQNTVSDQGLHCLLKLKEVVFNKSLKSPLRTIFQAYTQTQSTNQRCQCSDVLCSRPRRHLTLIQRRLYVMSMQRCIDVEPTLYKRHVPAGVYLVIICLSFVHIKVPNNTADSAGQCAWAC